MLNHALEITFALIVLYLVLAHATEFGTATAAIGQNYTSAVQALQGR